MKYIGVKDAAEKWNMTARRVQVLCSSGRIDGAIRVGNVWTIPENAIKPEDARKKVSGNRIKVNENVLIERVWAMPNKNTFEIKPIHNLIEEELTDGLWIDPFANRNKLATITNDLNKEYDTDYHIDALEFLKLFDDESVDGVLYDPPYSPRQVSECYNDVGYNVTWDTTKASFWGNHKREISRIVKKGGKVITFGWNSGGIGYKHGFEISRILLVPHGGWHNDTICTVEIKTHDGELETVKTKKVIKKNSMKKTDNDLIKILSELPSDYWDFKDEDTKEFTHGLHTYPAVMVSPISRNIIRIVKSIKSIDSLLDPFAGSGTVLVEGMLSGLKEVAGNDINPLALFLCSVKTKQLDISELQQAQNKLLSNINNKFLLLSAYIDEVDDYMRNLGLDLTDKNGWGTNAYDYLNRYCDEKGVDLNIPNFKNIGYWFKPRVIMLLELIKEEIEKVNNKDIKDFFYIAFSESIRLVSNRRNGEFKMFRMPPVKVEKFKPDVIREFKIILDRNVEKMHEFIIACEERNVDTDVKIFDNNVTDLKDIEDNRYDIIITSPPYGDSRTTVAYGEYSRLSLQWISFNDLSEKDIMGIDKSLMGGKKYRNGFELTLESQTLRKALDSIKEVDIERAGDVFSFYEDLDKAIKEIARVTKPDGYHFWVVGNRTVKNVLLETDKIISELASKHNMEYVHTINRNISNKVMPSLNSPTNETGKKVTTMTNEHIVILRKTG